MQERAHGALFCNLVQDGASHISKIGNSDLREVCTELLSAAIALVALCFQQLATYTLLVSRADELITLYRSCYNDCAVVCTMSHRVRTHVELINESITFCAIVNVVLTSIMRAQGSCSKS